MPQEGISESALIHHAEAVNFHEKYRSQSPKEVFERYKKVMDMISIRQMELISLQSRAEVLRAEVDPYVDKMNAIKDEREADAYYKSVPKSIFHSIDLLDATEDTIPRLKETIEALTNLSEELDRAYEQMRAEEDETAPSVLPFRFFRPPKD
ncbi:MAG: hypothetical protein AAB337_03905 [Patescibacteria group bacterium]